MVLRDSEQHHSGIQSSDNCKPVAQTAFVEFYIAQWFAVRADEIFERILPQSGKRYGTGFRIRRKAVDIPDIDPTSAYIRFR